MDLTWHWMQNAGAAAVAAMNDRPGPARVQDNDLDRAVQTIVTDALAAARAPKKGPGYAWQMALAAAYPNSPATHPARGRWSEVELRTRLEALFVADPVRAPWRCWCCEAPTATRWGKALWPLAAAAGEINTVARTERGRADGGHPVCRACRIAVWALPYTSVHDGATLTTVETTDGDLLMGVARLLVPHNRAIIATRAAVWPHPREPHGVRDLLTVGQVVLHVWRNDNREPHITSTHIPAATVPTPGAASTFARTHTITQT